MAAFGLGFIAMVGVILLAAGLYLITIYNGLVLLQQNVEKAWSNIDVLLKQRHEEVPNLVACVKGYLEHEKTVLEEVTMARSAVQASHSIAESGEASAQLTQALHQLFALSESYPDLKANESFLKLQRRLSEIEDHIADRREFYNDSAAQLNMRIKQFPDVLLAAPLNFKRAEFFQAEAEARKLVNVSFG